MRFRLLSYVAAILLLAGVLGANLMHLSYPSAYAEYATTSDRYKWPLTCLWYCAPTTRRNPGYCEVQWLALTANIAIGLTIPIAGLFACEFMLRRWSKDGAAKSR